jgi:hypothetical protein
MSTSPPVAVVAGAEDRAADVGGHRRDEVGVVDRLVVEGQRDVGAAGDKGDADEHGVRLLIAKIDVGLAFDDFEAVPVQGDFVLGAVVVVAGAAEGVAVRRIGGIEADTEGLEEVGCFPAPVGR